MSLLFFFAHPAEAASLLQRHHLLEKRDHLYRFSQFSVVISGMGSTNATYAMKQYALSMTKVINLGVAGSLTDSLPIGTVLQVQQVQSSKAEEPHLQLPHKGIRLLTVSSPLHDIQQKALLAERAELIDMEGYPIVQIAQQSEVDCQLIKVVSDTPLYGGSQQICRALPKLSEILANTAESCLLSLAK